MKTRLSIPFMLIVSVAIFGLAIGCQPEVPTERGELFGASSNDPGKNGSDGKSDGQCFKVCLGADASQSNTGSDAKTCKNFCAPSAGCKLVCSAGQRCDTKPGDANAQTGTNCKSELPACRWECPQPPPPKPCERRCDQECVKKHLGQNISEKEALARCCQPAPGDCNTPPPPPPTCREECDKQCVDAFAKDPNADQRIIKDRCCKKVCDGNGGTTPPPPPPPGTQCDEKRCRDICSASQNTDVCHKCLVDAGCKK